jgi:hypothetical protein
VRYLGILVFEFDAGGASEGRALVLSNLAFRQPSPAVHLASEVSPKQARVDVADQEGYPRKLQRSYTESRPATGLAAWTGCSRNWSVGNCSKMKQIRIFTVCRRHDREVVTVKQALGPTLSRAQIESAKIEGFVWETRFLAGPLVPHVGRLEEEVRAQHGDDTSVQLQDDTEKNLKNQESQRKLCQVLHGLVGFGELRRDRGVEREFGDCTDGRRTRQVRRR